MQHREIFAPKYLREIGKQFDLEHDVPDIAAADKMLSLHRELHAHKKRFLALMQTELGIATPTRALENWETLDSTACFAELAKRSGGTTSSRATTMTLAQKSEWLTHFEQERARAQSLREAIKTTDRQIDEMVFDLYGLTEEERALVRRA